MNYDVDVPFEEDGTTTYLNASACAASEDDLLVVYKCKIG